MLFRSKLKVKEVETFERPITVYEEAIWNIAQNGRFPHYRSPLCIRCQLEVGRIGLKDTFESRGGCIMGKFRITTTRDATPKEIIAWHTLQSLYVCSHDMPIQLCSQCANNLGPLGCHIDRIRERAEGILKDKEVILSVTEE